MEDMRQWLERADKLGFVKKINGADWNLEIGAITTLNHEKEDSDILLFDNIKGYRAGYRVVAGSTSSCDALALCMKLPTGLSMAELLDVYIERQLQWDSKLDKFPFKVVKKGPVMENRHKGKDINLLEFPVPKWHELDGGRYIGTANAVITKDPDTGDINFGTYRMMVQNSNTASLFVLPGKHARLHYEKYHARGKSCPIAISYGHHPLFFKAACVNLPPGKEYNYVGSVAGEPVKVITEEITGLPIPADSEIVVAGWCPPDKLMIEAPFGEWTGYYATKEAPAPVVEIERIYHRNDPILLGNPPTGPLGEPSASIQGSARIYTQLARNGYTAGIKRVWLNRAGREFMILVSMHQMYAGHSKDIAMFLLQNRALSPLGRYVIVLDEDIDPMDPQQVLWAIGTRTDPVISIDIIKRTRSVSMDPLARKPAKAFFTSRAIIDTCKPYEWIDDFPPLVKLSPELEKKTREKWGKTLFPKK